MGRRQEAQRRAMYDGLLGGLGRAWDSVVGTIAPGTALEMRKSRLRAATLLSYEAARINRTMGSAGSGSADAEALPDLQVLRDRSRAMVRDDAHAAAAVRVMEENVVGKGLMAQSICTPEATGMTPDECQAWNNQCEAWFGEWASTMADATNYGTFYDLQRIVARSMMSDGEALGHAATKGSLMVCELIDPDRLQSPNWQDTDRVRGGVELDGFGAPTRYHVLPQHPADMAFGAIRTTTPLPIAARDGEYSLVQHVFRRDRPGQTRGVPWLAAALPFNTHVHEYLNSEMIAARANSAVAMFVKRPASTLDADIQAGSGGDDANFLQTLKPGTIEYLEEGEEIQPFMPNRPGTQFDSFVTRMLRAIWSSQGLAYELVAKDFGGMNYSSARSMLLECRRGFDGVRQMLIRQFCRPWWANVVRNGISIGRLPAPRAFVSNPEAFLAARWIAPSYGWVDPVKEIEASSQAIAANLSTPYDEASRAGNDAEHVLRDRARFLQLAGKVEAEFGLEQGVLTATAKPAGQVPPPPTKPPTDTAAPAPGDGQDPPLDPGEEDMNP